MKIDDILLEYERARAMQALGAALWRAALRDDLNLGAHVKDLETYADEYGANKARYVYDVLNNLSLQQKLANDAMAKIEATDPTTNKQYTQWMARQFINGSEPHLEDITSTLATYVRKFHLLNRKHKLQPPENDINRYKTARQLYDTMEKYPDPEDASEDNGRATKLLDSDDVMVVVPLDQAAACRYGRQARWCTAATSGMNYFDSYNQRGPLYILIPKHPRHSGEKYQLHFVDEQYMDENDDPVDLDDLLTKRFPGLVDFFLKLPEEAEQIKDMLVFQSDDTLQRLSDEVWDIVKDKVMDVYTDWEVRDEAYYTWLVKQGYVDDEGDIDWDTAPKYDEYNDDARQWLLDMEECCNPPPGVIRKWARDEYDYTGEIHSSVLEFDQFIAGMCAKKMRDQDAGIPDWIIRNIQIEKRNGEFTTSMVKRS